MTNLQECLSYLSDIDFDRETLKAAREELAYVTQRANGLPTQRANGLPADVVSDASWNAALEAAAVTAEGNARELRDGHPPFTTTHEVMDEAEAEALERFAVEIRALKRTT